jgi:hypothetical protein
MTKKSSVVWVSSMEIGVGENLTQRSVVLERITCAMTAIDLDFNPSMQQLGQNVLPVFDSLVSF